MVLELDMTPPVVFQLDLPRSGSDVEPSRDVLLDNSSYREKSASGRVRKSQSWSVQLQKYRFNCLLTHLISLAASNHMAATQRI